MKYDAIMVYKLFKIDEVRKLIAKRYDGTEDGFSNIGRLLFIHRSDCNYGQPGCLFFALNGSPPKGYAIYVPDHNYLVIIDAWGKSTRYNSVKLVDENDELVDIKTFDSLTILERIDKNG